MKKSKMLWILCSALLLINLVEYTTIWGGEVFLTYFSDILAFLFAFIATVCLFFAVKAFKECDSTKKAWLSIFIGIATYTTAELIYAVLELVLKLDMDVVYPSLADYFWVIAYIPLLIGILMMFFVYKKSGFPMGKPAYYVTISIISLLIMVLVIYFLLIPIVLDDETSLLAKIFYLFYPIGDVLVLIPVFLLMYITSLFGKGALSKPWKYLAIGFFIFTVADILYAYLDWQGLYGSGSYIDLLFNSGYMFIGLAGLYQKELVESFKGE
ncbi:MAG: hypothetical protein GX587_00580 [Bacteroidales bacterium]|nr:hypothetical protein [Bacteroidales bacterium]